MPIEAEIEERRMRFEARRLAVETYVKVHVDRTAGARLLVSSYFRLIFTLSLGTLAALVTFGSAWARLGRADALGPVDPIAIGLSAATVVSLILSAIFAANGLRRAAGWSIQSVRDPLPKSGSVIADALGKEQAGENEIFGHLMVSIDEMSQSGDLDRLSFLPPLMSYLAAVLCAVLSVVHLSV